MLFGRKCYLNSFNHAIAMQTVPDDLDADVGIFEVIETVLVVPVVGIGSVETVFFVGTVVGTRS
jgi:hypothetical protein